MYYIVLKKKSVFQISICQHILIIIEVIKTTYIQIMYLMQHTMTILSAALG